MTEQTPKRLTPVEAKAMAETCRSMAKVAQSDSHRIMLISIADTWDRIAKETKWEQ